MTGYEFIKHGIRRTQASIDMLERNVRSGNMMQQDADEHLPLLRQQILDLERDAQILLKTAEAQSNGHDHR